MRGCGDKRSYNGDNKTKEDECKSVNTTYNLFCSFISDDDDANIALRHFSIIFLGTWILKNSLSLFTQWHGERGWGELMTNGGMRGEGGLKIAVFEVMSFLNDPKKILLQESCKSLSKSLQ